MFSVHQLSSWRHVILRRKIHNWNFFFFGGGDELKIFFKKEHWLFFDIHSRQNHIFIWTLNKHLHKIKHTVKSTVIFLFVPQVSVSVWCQCTSVRSPLRICEASWASFRAFTFVSESSLLRSSEFLNSWERYWHQHSSATQVYSCGWLGSTLLCSLWSDAVSGQVWKPFRQISSKFDWLVSQVRWLLHLGCSKGDGFIFHTGRALASAAVPGCVSYHDPAAAVAMVSRESTVLVDREGRYSRHHRRLESDACYVWLYRLETILVTTCSSGLSSSKMIIIVFFSP